MAAEGDNEVNIKFGASIDDLKSKMDEVHGIFENLIGKFAALAAVVAGGTAFKAFIDEANTLNGEAMKLSNTLGITGEEAGTLNSALALVGSDADTYSAAFLKFTRQLKTHSDQMKELGVDTDALASGQKTGNQVFMESLGIVMQYAAGQDRNRVAMELFGRSVADVQKLAKLLNIDLEEVRKRNEDLNLTITEEGVAASKKYKIAMAEVQEVLHGLEKTIGEAVIPHFTEMAEKLASIGPTLVQAMQYMVQVLVDVWDRVGETVGRAGEIVLGVLTRLVDAFGGGETKDGMEAFRGGLQGLQDALFDLFDGIDEVIDGAGEMLDVFVTAAIEIGKGISGLIGLFNDHTDAVDRSAKAMGPFGEMGRAVGDVFRVIAVVAANVIFVLEGVGREIGAVGAQLVALAHLDVAGFHAISDAVKEDGVRARAELDALEKRIMDGSSATPSESPRIERPDRTPKGAPAGGDRLAPIGKKDKDTAAKEAAAENALAKAQHEAELALTKEYLKEAQAIYDDANKQGLLSIREFYDAKLAIELKGIEETLAARRLELAEANAGAAAAGKYEEKLKFMAQAAKLQGEINVLTAQEVEAVRANTAAREDAERKLADELAAIKAQSAKAIADDEILTDKKALDQKRQLRQIDAQAAFEEERALEERSLQASLAALAAKRAAIQGDVGPGAEKSKAALYAEEEALYRTHEQKMRDIDRSAQLERSRYSLQAQQSIQGSFSTMINNLLSGNKKLGDAFRDFARSVQATFTNLIAQKFTEKLFDATGAGRLIDKMVGFLVDGIAKMVGEWIVGESTKTAASVTGSTTRATAESTASAASMAVQQAEGIAAVLSYASVAAVAAMSSVAAIPFVGWAMAPEVGAATYAMGLGYLASAEGGWDEIPSDQIIKAHEKEMVLSAPLAEGIRSMVTTGGGSSLVNSVEQVVTQLGSDKGRPLGPQGGTAENAGWHIPANPLAKIQAGSGFSTAGDGAGAGAARARGDSQSTVQLVGQSAGDFFITNRKHLLKVLGDAGRNGSRPS